MCLQPRVLQPRARPCCPPWQAGLLTKGDWSLCPGGRVLVEPC